MTITFSSENGLPNFVGKGWRMRTQSLPGSLFPSQESLGTRLFSGCENNCLRNYNCFKHWTESNDVPLPIQTCKGLFFLYYLVSDSYGAVFRLVYVQMVLETYYKGCCKAILGTGKSTLGAGYAFTSSTQERCGAALNSVHLFSTSIH